MAVSIKFYLDTRKLRADGTAPLKIMIRVKRKAAMLDTRTSVRPEFWDDANERITGKADIAKANQYVRWVRAQIDTLIMQHTVAGDLGDYDAFALRDMAAAVIFGEEPPKRTKKANLFITRFMRFTEMKTGGTKRIYEHTLSRMRAFDAELEKRGFEDITVDWLREFELFLRTGSPSQNARNIHLRNIRAVFNDAIDSEITTAYPFRRLRIRPEPTAKRSLSIEKLREFWFFEPEETTAKYHDLFKLIFLLIGINVADLHALTPASLFEGRVEYKRAKTHRPYSIKVEPEAQEIIDRYKGDKHLLCFGDTYADPRDLLRRINRGLATIGPVEIGKQGKKTYQPLQPQITTYWARHSWATIAALLDIPRETIAHALGHGNNTVTDIYIDFDRAKVDEANRRVIDWVLYGKK